MGTREGNVALDCNSRRLEGGTGLSAQPWASRDWTADNSYSGKTVCLQEWPKKTEQNGNYPVVCSSSKRFQCNKKSNCSDNHISSLCIILAYVRQGRLNVKAVWGHTDWLFAVR